MSNSILLKIENKIAFITLNRPEVFNSFNREMALTFQDTLDACKKDDEVRAIVLTGRGKAFCAGQDLKEVTSPELNPGFKKILEEHYNPIILRIRNIEKPIIAAVNGVAAGAGISLFEKIGAAAALKNLVNDIMILPINSKNDKEIINIEGKVQLCYKLMSSISEMLLTSISFSSKYSS